MKRGWTAIAIMGLHEDANHCVSADGQWLPEYAPALFRAYPFQLDPASDKLELWPGYAPEPLGPPEVEPFFVGDRLSEPVQRTLDFLRRVQCAIAVASEPLELLADIGALSPVDTRGIDFDTSGALMLDGGAFDGLPDDDWLRLRRLGAISWLYAHMASLQHFGRINRLANHPVQRGARQSIAFDRRNDVNGFLDALARDASVQN